MEKWYSKKLFNGDMYLVWILFIAAFVYWIFATGSFEFSPSYAPTASGLNIFLAFVLGFIGVMSVLVSVLNRKDVSNRIWIPMWLIILIINVFILRDRTVKTVVDHGNSSTKTCMFYDIKDGYLDEESIDISWYPWSKISIEREEFMKTYSWSKEWYYSYHGVNYKIPLQGKVDVITHNEGLYDAVIAVFEKPTFIEPYKNRMENFIDVKIAENVLHTLKQKAKNHNLSPEEAINEIEPVTLQILREYNFLALYPNSCNIVSI